MYEPEAVITGVYEAGVETGEHEAEDLDTVVDETEKTWKQKKGVVARDGPPALCHSVRKLRGRHDVERGLASGEIGHPSLDHGVAV